jgi:hypothetical protein
MEKRLNCWEYKNCGYGSNENYKKNQICPTVSEDRLDGIHKGAKAGRACWF